MCTKLNLYSQIFLTPRYYSSSRDERRKAATDRHLPVTAPFTFIALMPNISACQAYLYLGRNWNTKGVGVGWSLGFQHASQEWLQYPGTHIPAPENLSGYCRFCGS